MMALNTLDYMDGRASSAKAAIASLPDEDRKASDRVTPNLPKLMGKILAELG